MQWNLRNIGPQLYKVANEVDSLYSSPLVLTYARWHISFAYKNKKLKIIEFQSLALGYSNRSRLAFAINVKQILSHFPTVASVLNNALLIHV